MPINDLGYRPIRAQPESSGRRWWVIAETGVRLAWKSQWLRRMMVLAWFPAVYLGVSIFAFERSVTDRSGFAIMAARIIEPLPNGTEIARTMASNPAGARHEVWALVLLTLFRYPQGVLMVMLIGLIAPSLVARDTRSRAYQLYFSRPINRFDYVVGKSAVVWVYVAMVTTLPAMALYVLGLCLSPELSVVFDTWDLPFRILGASVCLIVPTTSLALCFSSLVTESRYAAFAWFAMWILGWVAIVNLTMMDAYRFGRLDIASESRWTFVSLYHSLGQIQSWIFGLTPDFSEVQNPCLLWIAITVISFGILIRRVTAPLRV